MWEWDPWLLLPVGNSGVSIIDPVTGQGQEGEADGEDFQHIHTYKRGSLRTLLLTLEVLLFL